MTSTERAHVRRRRRVVAAAVLAASATSCADQPTAVDQPTVAPVVGSATPTPTTTRGVDTPGPSHPHRRPAPTPARIGTAPGITIPRVWADLVQCEAHGDWRYGAPGHPGDPGYREYEGGPNFVHSTWTRYGGARYALHAYDATPLQQLVIARRVLRAEGVHAWPVCGPRVGLTMEDAA